MAHLIEEGMAGGLSLAEATRAVLRRLRGAFSIAVISADEPDTIVGRLPPDAARPRGCRRRGAAWRRTSRP